MCFGSESDNVESTTRVELPWWYSASASRALGRAEEAATQPYTQFGGERIAGFTPQQQQAFDLTGGNVGTWQPGLGSAMDIAEGVAGAPYTPGRFDPGMIQDYMNPYTEQVIDTSLRRYDESAEQARNRLGAEAAMTGALGGGRHGVAEAELERGIMEDRARIASDLYGRSYEQAASLAPSIYASDEGRALAADEMNRRFGLGSAEMMADLSQLGAGLGYADVDALMRSGALQQALEQAEIDVPYQYFREERDWPLRGVNLMTGALGGTPVGQTSTTTGQQPGANPFAQTVGALATGASLLWPAFG